jgi:outer membrane protein, adhesin transport system
VSLKQLFPIGQGNVDGHVAADRRITATALLLLLMLTATAASAGDVSAAAAPQMQASSNHFACEGTRAVRATAPVGAYNLEALARLAATGHASVAARRATVHATQAELEAAQLQYWPSPSAQTSPGVGGGRTTVLTLEQPLWTSGRIDGAIDAAKARTQSAGHAVAESQQTVGLAVVNAYHVFAQARGRAAVMRRFLDRLERYRESMQRRVDTGASAPGELELLQARQSLAAGQLGSACSAERVARGQLSTLANIELSAEAVVSPTFASDIPDLGELLSRSQQYSPVLRRLDQDVQAAQGEAGARAALRWPTVALVAQRSLQQGVPNTQSSTSMGLQLQFTPGAGFSSLALARAAQAQVESLRASREAARMDLLSKIRSEHEELRSAVDRRQDGLTNVAAAGRVLASYERLFAVGKRSWLDVLNAARELSDAEITVADTEAQVIASRYRLALYGAEPEWMKAGP